MKTVASLLVLLFTVSAFAQQQPVPFIETLQVSIHSIDVVVTDKSGKNVTGLKQDDFELYEDGKRKPISNFSAYVEEITSQTAATAKPGSDLRVAPPESARKIVFYVDDMALTADTRKTLREQLDAMVLKTMRPGDEAMVVRPTQEERLGTGFTQDRDAVRSWLDIALRDQDWRSAPVQLEKIQFETEMKAAGPQQMRRMISRRWADMVRRRVKQRLGNLKSAVIAASAIQGRKVMVVVSDSLPIEPGREAFRAYKDTVEYTASDVTNFPSNAIWDIGPTNPDMQYDWFDLAPLVKDIGRTAASAGITIYAIQPEIHLGVSAPGGGIDTAPPPIRFSPGMNSAAPQGNSNVALSDPISNTETTMRILTDLTGGRWFRGAGTVDEATEQIVTDVQSYYSLGYRAGEGTDVVRKIDVRVKGRKDLTVRARKEVVRKSPEHAMADSVVAALIDTTVPSEVPVRIEVEPGAMSEDGSREMKIHALISMSALTFLSEGNVQRARYSLHYAAMGKGSEFVNGMQAGQMIDVPAADLQDAKSKYFRYILPLKMKPGKHELTIGVLDSVSRQSGIARTTVIVQ